MEINTIKATFVSQVVFSIHMLIFKIIDNVFFNVSHRQSPLLAKTIFVFLIVLLQDGEILIKIGHVLITVLGYPLE